MRKNEAAKLKRESMLSGKATNKLGVTNKANLEAHLETGVESSSPTPSSIGQTISNDAVNGQTVPKKKEYTVNVESVEAGDNKEEVEEKGKPEKETDPAEFARQERLRKQREKQVLTIDYYFNFYRVSCSTVGYEYAIFMSWSLSYELFHTYAKG